MDGQQNTATIDELIRAIRFAGTEQRRNLHGWLVTGHFVFGGLAVAAWLVALICKLAGHQIGDRLTDEYFFSLMTSVMFFAVGTLMIEYMRGDIFAQALGRVLAGCGLFVMSAQGYEFMQESRAIEIEASILAKARPVSEYQPAIYLREVEMNGFRVHGKRSIAMDGEGPCSLFEDNVQAKLIALQQAVEDLIRCLEENPEEPPAPMQNTTPVMAEDPSKPISRVYYEAKARMLRGSLKEFSELIKAPKI